MSPGAGPMFFSLPPLSTTVHRSVLLSLFHRLNHLSLSLSSVVRPHSPHTSLFHPFVSHSPPLHRQRSAFSLLSSVTDRHRPTAKIDMGKKKGIAAIFSKPRPAEGAPPSPPWPWPSCASTPQTASFRGYGDDHRPCTTAGRPGPSLAGAGRLVPPRTAAGDMYRTVNSVYYVDPGDACGFAFDDEEDGDGDEGGEALEELDDGVSYSTTTASEEWSEAVIRSLGRRTCTDRFFFDSGGPPPASNSILAASRSPSPSPSPSPGRTLLATQHSPVPKAPAPAPAVMFGQRDRDSDAFLDEEEDEQEDPRQLPPSPLVEESVAVALDSDDPYSDFRASMEEMVSAHGLRDWASLQEMLVWYLRINGKHNHALIVGAFVDLLVNLATTSSSPRSVAAVTTTTATTTTTGLTATSSSASSTSSSVAGEEGGASSSVAATVDEHEQRGSSGSCSPAVSSYDEEEPPVATKKASGGDELPFHVKLSKKSRRSSSNLR